MEKCNHVWDLVEQYPHRQWRCIKCGDRKLDDTSVVHASAPEQKRGAELCSDAINTVNGERQDQYGNPEDSFAMIAVRWTQYLHGCGYVGATLDARNVAFMLADMKMARQCNQHKRDNLVDCVGYLGLLDDMTKEG